MLKLVTCLCIILFVMARAEITELANRDANTTECTKLVNYLGYTGLSVASNASSCITDQLSMGVNYTVEIIEAGNALIDRLVKFKDEVRECTKNLANQDAIAKAIPCIKDIGINTGVAAVKLQIKIAVNIGKIALLVSSFQTNVMSCATDKVVQSFFEVVPAAVGLIGRCIKQKMNEIVGNFMPQGLETDRASERRIGIQTD